MSTDLGRGHRVGDTAQRWGGGREVRMGHRDGDGAEIREWGIEMAMGQRWGHCIAVGMGHRDGEAAQG